MHPFRFAVSVSRARTGDDWIARARQAEDLGYDVLLMTDHLGAQLSPFAALGAAAAATTRIHLGTYVLANDYRHPLMLAREASTLDLLSGGRFELGMGAGWNTADYRGLGMPYDAPGRRIDRLADERAVGFIQQILDEHGLTKIGGEPAHTCLPP